MSHIPVCYDGYHITKPSLPPSPSRPAISLQNSSHYPLSVLIFLTARARLIVCIFTPRKRQMLCKLFHVGVGWGCLGVWAHLLITDLRGRSTTKLSYQIPFTPQRNNGKMTGGWLWYASCPGTQLRGHTLQFHCNMVNFLPNTHNRHPVACQGRLFFAESKV